MTKALGQIVRLSMSDDLPVAFAESEETAKFTLDALQGRGFIRSLTGATGVDSQGMNVVVSGDGIARMQELEEARGRELSAQVFVAMWFNKGLDEVYEEGIVPAIKDCGLNPLRIDAKETNQKVCDEIIAEIRRSKFLVADCTGSRGGVYFEAGFAMGLGIPVIWTCRNREDDIKELHFDTRQYSHVLWDDAADMRKKLRNRIAATIPGVRQTWRDV